MMVAVAWLALGVSIGTGLSARAADLTKSADNSGLQEVVVGAGKSQVIELPRPYVDVTVADPKIADILPLNARSVYIVGKKMGATAVNVYGAHHSLIAAVNVVVSADLESFKARLHEIFPDEKAIAVKPANESIVLYGTVSSPLVLGQIITLANSYAPGKVVNMLSVEIGRAHV